jgi:type IV fimbrial biogenesis protein FimT
MASFLVRTTDRREEGMQQQGLTQVELIVGLAILAILLAIAIPGYGNFMNYNRLVAATNTLVSSLQLARSEAIKRRSRVTVCKSSAPMDATPTCDAGANWEQGWLVFVDGGTKGVLDIGDQILKVHGAVPEADITPSNFSAYASYLPSGTSQAPNGLGNGTLHICLAGNKRSIIINSIGRIRIRKSTC